MEHTYTLLLSFFANGFDDWYVVAYELTLAECSARAAELLPFINAQTLPVCEVRFPE